MSRTNSVATEHSGTVIANPDVFFLNLSSFGKCPSYYDDVISRFFIFHFPGNWSYATFIDPQHDYDGVAHIDDIRYFLRYVYSFATSYFSKASLAKEFYKTAISTLWPIESTDMLLSVCHQDSQ